MAAAGRIPNLEGINVEEVKLEMERRFIKVDHAMRTNLPEVYAIGDLTSSPMLAHIASYEAEIVIKQYLAAKKLPIIEAVPAVVYTHPELAGRYY